MVSALETGARLDDYKIRSELGRGGFGITYQATDMNLGNDVAIKEYYPSDFAERKSDGSVGPVNAASEADYQWGLDRFLEEARTLARFANEKYIVSVLRFFQRNGTAYLVMEFVDGISIAEYSENITNPQQVEQLFAKLKSGLQKVHIADFLHRDLKPDNILIRISDSEPVLIDFGSARQLKADRTMALITPYYSPIEQYASDADHGRYTDIYSLSATFYRVITGKPPPDASSRILDDQCKKLADDAALSIYSPDFLAQIDAGMAPRPGERPQDIDSWGEIKRLDVTHRIDFKKHIHKVGANDDSISRLLQLVEGRLRQVIESVGSFQKSWVLVETLERFRDKRVLAGFGVLVAAIVFFPNGPKQVLESPQVKTQNEIVSRWNVSVSGNRWEPIGLLRQLGAMPKGKKYELRFDATEQFRSKTADRLMLADVQPGRKFSVEKGEVYLKNIDLYGSQRVTITLSAENAK